MFRSLILAMAMLCTASPAGAGEPDYARDIAPLLRTKCVSCHGAVRQRAGLRLDAGQLVLKGNKDGPVVVPGKPEESLLIEAITVPAGEKHAHMPPEGEGEPFREKDLALIREWVRLGAKAPVEPVPEGPQSHWAYQPPKKHPVPGPGNPIDAFLAAERARHHLQPLAEADKPTVLRRVYLDLIGIPPTPAELDAFLKDDSPTAYETVVNRLLASHMYGERWGRHWMDIWRYSDPFGNGEEYRYSQRHIWHWRDWIIESLNADKGYDRMILEMLAGDEIAPGDAKTLRATGYLARNWYKFNRNAWIQDTVEYTAAGFLATTLRCARCHDHKYDPISQKDYYRFRAVFEPHDVRTDAIPGQPDVTKAGIPRAYDKTLDAATYLYFRGDERTPDRSRVIEPGVPGVFGSDLQVSALRFEPRDFAATLPAEAEAARSSAKQALAQAESNAKKANESLTRARQQVQDLAAGKPVKAPELTPMFRDTFASQNQDLWNVQSGDWKWEKGKLVCKSSSSFATVSTRKQHPSSLMGRMRFKITGGDTRSVGFNFDITGKQFQGVYINAGPNSAVRPHHRKDGKTIYAKETVPHPVNVQDEITLDFAVRGTLLNIWVNGELKQVYRLPMERHAGVFSIWAHHAAVEFSEVSVFELPEWTILSEKPGDTLPSPVDSPGQLTVADAEKFQDRAEKAATLANARLATAGQALASVEARYQADLARFAEPRDETLTKQRAIAAAESERELARLQAAETALTMPPDQKPKESKTETKASTKMPASEYTSLVKVDPVQSTGRRLALAKWIADPQNPLTARVAVNHIWMRHFGMPLVASVTNFGLSGKKPTHPELLDWLAVELTQTNWSMKHLHRLIVTSQAYRLGSQNQDGPSKTADPENRLYWRANARRMDAEVVRDSLLALTGQLDRTLGGPIIDEKQGLTSRRRSLYFRFNAEYKMSFLDQFDAASPTECFERRESVIPQQALALHNSTLALNVSRELARQLAGLADSPAFIREAFRQVLGREPSREEQARCAQFLEEQTELFAKPGKLTPFPAGLSVTPPSTDPKTRAREDLVHVLLNHNDFVTIR